MKLVIFGLTVSSAWGNGHATLWRGLCRGLANLGHGVVFFERDVPYYAQARDLTEVPGAKLLLYSSWDEAAPTAEKELEDADAAIITSYCPDAISALEALTEAKALRVFYDLDTPVTLAQIEAGARVDYLPGDGLKGFDLVLSYTGGEALAKLRTMLGAHSVAPLYGSVDPEAHYPVNPKENYRADLSYLGTYAADRQETLMNLFIEPARRSPQKRFLIGGSLYPRGFPWTSNMHYIYHVPPPQHSEFYCSGNLNLNVTRGAMANMGYCPSGRLFEAAACGAPILSDCWAGLEQFFTPGEEVLIARSTEETLDHLRTPASELKRLGEAARKRALGEHTADRRAATLARELRSAGTGR